MRVDGAVLKVKDIEVMFGFLWENVDVSIQAKRSFAFVFILRRILMAVMFLLLQQFPFATIQISLFLNLFMMIHTTNSRPFKRPSLNRKEIINEAFVLTSCNLLVLFTGFCPDVMTQYHMGGWAHMVVLGLCILFNLAFVFAEPFR